MEPLDRNQERAQHRLVAEARLATYRGWQLVKIVAGSVVWLALVALTYYSLLTIPILVLLGLWLYYTVTEYFRPPKKPADDRHEEDPLQHR